MRKTSRQSDNTFGWYLALLWTLMLVLLVTLSGCTPVRTYAEIGAGKNGSLANQENPWDDMGGVGFYGALRAEWDSREVDFLSYVCHYAHYSQWNVSTGESSLDHVGCAYRINISND